MNPTDIKLLLLDVDGVLTDGSILLDETGRQIMRFHVRDGLGIKAWRTLGLSVGILTSRSGRALTHRAAELGIDLVEQGAGDKLVTFENICRRTGVLPEQVAYLGDDLPDLPVLCRVGYPMAVRDAAAEVQQVAKYITKQPGGRGAVRDAIEHLLSAMGRWDEVLESYGL
jgi:3-deoxy-D-manno-octulosonate 8-phosphate phosphatase (KDO 8-P phosphatase)